MALGLEGTLDQSQIADAINRQKVGTQRQKNEMMRLGTTDPNSFAMQNQKQLQEAQQPHEFWGAGRKIAEDQNPDLDAANMINPLVKLGGVYNYYGNTDSSSAKWGTPYGKTDIGGGKYNILGSQGQSLGTGYKSLSDSISEMYKSANSPTAVTKWKDYTGPIENLVYKNKPSYFDYGVGEWVGDSQVLDETQFRKNPNYQAGYIDESYGMHPSTGGSQYQKLFNGYDWKGSDYDTLEQANAARDATAGSYYTGNNIRDWETLGQLLTQGNVTDTTGKIGSLGGNQVSDYISGMNTLYGSTPLLFKDKLYGYKNAIGDTTPVTNEWDFGDQNAGKWANEYNRYYGNAGLGREYSNPDWWSQNTRKLSGDNYFVSADKAAQNPGWYNKDYYNAEELHKSIPNGRVKDTSVGVGIGNALGMYFTGVPIGSLVSAGVNYSDGNEKAGNAALGQAAISYGLSGLDFGIDTGYGAMANSALNSAATGAIGAGLGSALNGGSNVGQNMFLGALGGAAGSTVGGLTAPYGSAISNALGGFTKSAVSNLGSKNALESALSSGLGSGLGGLFNQATGETDTKKQSQNVKTGQQAVKLAQLFRNSNGRKTTTTR